MHSNESSENYLETILILSKKLPVVRSVDIANEPETAAEDACRIEHVISAESFAAIKSHVGDILKMGD